MIESGANWMRLTDMAKQRQRKKEWKWKKKKNGLNVCGGKGHKNRTKNEKQASMQENEKKTEPKIWENEKNPRNENMKHVQNWRRQETTTIDTRENMKTENDNDIYNTWMIAYKLKLKQNELASTRIIYLCI